MLEMAMLVGGPGISAKKTACLIRGLTGGGTGGLDSGVIFTVRGPSTRARKRDHTHCHTTAAQQLLGFALCTAPQVNLRERMLSV